MKGARTRILIADDHAVVRRGLGQLLEESLDGVEIIEAGDGKEALDLIRKGDFHLLLLDIAMPGRDGLEVLTSLRKTFPSLPVLIFSMYSEEQYAIRALRAGAAGYVTKQSAPSKVIDAVRCVLDGGTYVSPAVTEYLVQQLGGRGVGERHEQLSDRELQVLRRLASGQRIKEIAVELSLSPNTVSTYQSRILEKLGFQSTAALIRYAIDTGLVQ